MPSNRDPGRQRRANENRAARQALAARRESAARKESPAEPEGAPRRRFGRTRAQAMPVPPPKASRPRPSTPPASSGAVPGGSSDAAVGGAVDPVGGWRGWFLSARGEPGGPQMLGAAALAVVGSLQLFFLTRIKEKGRETSESLYQYFGPAAVLLVLLPVVVAAAPLVFMHHPRRRFAWNAATFLFGIWVLTAGAGVLFYLVAVAMMVWGVMRLSKADGPRPPLFGRRRTGEAIPTSGSEQKPGRRAG